MIYLDFLQLIHSLTKGQLGSLLIIFPIFSDGETKPVADFWIQFWLLCELPGREGLFPPKACAVLCPQLVPKALDCNRRILLRNDADLREHLKHLAWKPFPQHFKHCRVGDGREGVRRMALGCSLSGMSPEMCEVLAGFLGTMYATVSANVPLPTPFNFCFRD